jgi:tRNA G18 (ribose-2'-O)-methylase SpoU
MAYIIETDDLSLPELQPYVSVSEVQLMRYYEPETGIFIAESPKVIRRAIETGYKPISILAERKYITGQAADIIEKCGDIPVYTADSDVLTQLTGFRLTQGVLCAMRRKNIPDVEEICSGATRIAVLENIMNQTNVGAIFRSAAALGFDAVLLTSGCSDPLYRRSVRVSMGTVFQIPWTYFDCSDTEYVNKLKQLGFSTVAMALRDDSVGINDKNLMSEKKLALIFGTEGDGLKDTTIESCDYTVKIPMYHGVDSLNVAAASAVAFYQLGHID